MNFVLIRGKVTPVPGGESFTPGVLYLSGLKICYTCEDEDRRLEIKGAKTAKVYGKTAIARGIYTLMVSFSNRFQKELPEVLGVEGFSGIRMHGGNKAEHSLGCILLGNKPTATGVSECAPAVNLIIGMIKSAMTKNEPVTLEIK